MNYLIILFKNKEKRKIINKFKTKKKALDFFNKQSMSSDNVIFEKRTENGSKCHFELLLMEKKEFGLEKIYIKDELGRTTKVETDSDDYNVLKIINYKIEEEFLDYSTKKKITSNVFEKKYLSYKGIKMISKLNNKIIFQSNEQIKLFTFKDEYDAERFIESIESKMRSEKRGDCIFVKDFSFPQKKYLYNLLIENGFPKSYLQRYSTTHPLKK
jgi:hypothetical protein